MDVDTTLCYVIILVLKFSTCKSCKTLFYAHVLSQTEALEKKTLFKKKHDKIFVFFFQMFHYSVDVIYNKRTEALRRSPEVRLNFT